MRSYLKIVFLFVFFAVTTSLVLLSASAQSSSGTIQGVVKDPAGAVIPGATVTITNPVSKYTSETTTGDRGDFRFVNVPFNPYHMTVNAPKFAPYTRDVEVRSGVPINLEVLVKIEATTTLTVESAGQDLIENEPTAHTDIDRGLFDKMPLESTSSGLSSLVTLGSPGAVADSNGLVHGIGDHAQNSFIIDNQAITDQTSKVFSNQIPVDAVQSLEVIAGAPPAEFGDKTSLVVKVNTRSGLGLDRPVGSFVASYGTFGTITGALSYALGNDKWGNFFSGSGFNTSRFLDPPEFQAVHARGNQQNGFDRLDYQISPTSALHLNTGYTRSWFQTPNSFEAQNQNAFTTTLFTTPQDQRAQIQTYNAAPSWTYLFRPSMLFTLSGFGRYDIFNYYPSANPLADLTQTTGQQRTLLNAGGRADLSYVKGIHNIKVGVVVQHTLLIERFQIGLTDPTVNDPCLTVNAAGTVVGAGDKSINDPANCAAKGFQPNVASNPNATSPFVPLLGCFDLTRPTPAAADGCAGTTTGLFSFRANTDIKQYAGYIQDAITAGNWTFNLGVRGDGYYGLVHAWQPQPRGGISYNLKRTNTVLRISYARLFETPFNENLIVSSSGTNPVLGALFGQSAAGQIEAGQRNEFHAGFQQAFGKLLVIDADYVWKYTHNGFDFSDLLNTPIFFPISWHNSKIGGPIARVSVPNYHGMTAFVVLGSVYARFFDPQVGGLGSSPPVGVFRIDHDQQFQQTTHIQYQPWKRGPWLAFNWRYDSGLVAGRVPFAVNSTTPVDLTGLTGDQQVQGGLFCGNVFPTVTKPLITCPPSLYGSTLINLPAPGTQNPDLNPQRIKPRNLFDASIGDDNLFLTDRYKVSVRVSAINLTNKKALYNYLSTFSGTHYVTPRAATVELGFHF